MRIRHQGSTDVAVGPDSRDEVARGQRRGPVPDAS